MKKIIRIIIFIIVFIILLSGILIVRLNKKEEQYEQEEKDNYVVENNENTLNQISNVTDSTIFFTIEACAQKYLDNSIINIRTKDKIDLNYEYTEPEIRKEAVYNLLTSHYIKEKQVTNQNVLDYIHNIQEQVNFTATNMKVYQNNDRIQQYSVTGFIENTATGNFTENIYLLVIIDIDNKTFQIEPLLNGSDLNTDFALNAEITAIESNGYNTFEYYKVSKNDMPQKYMEFYTKLALNYPQTAYQYLNQEYREKRFGNVEKYIEYIKLNENEIRNTILDRYQIEIKDEYTQYVCIDSEENYYIFRETGIRQFELILDTHTVDIPEFLAKYNSANEQQKVAMNIEKVVEALNMKDYSYVYQKLDEGFRQNYFKTEQDFIQYCNLIFVNKNKVTYGDFEVKGNTYIYNVSLTDRKGESIRVLDKQFIMKLKDGTDFVCSFTTGDDKLIDDAPQEGNN